MKFLILKICLAVLLVLIACSEPEKDGLLIKNTSDQVLSFQIYNGDLAYIAYDPYNPSPNFKYRLIPGQSMSVTESDIYSYHEGCSLTIVWWRSTLNPLTNSLEVAENFKNEITRDQYSVGYTQEISISEAYLQRYGGFLYTDYTGQVLGGDSLDWIPYLEESGDITIPSSFHLMPAFPNPTDGPLMTIGFMIPVYDSVLITAHEAFSNSPDTIASGYFPPGYHAISWEDNHGVGTSVKRIKMSTSSGFESYGDIKRTISAVP